MRSSGAQRGAAAPSARCGRCSPLPSSAAEIIEDVAESPAPPAVPVCAAPPPSQEEAAYKRLGLTKEVLAAHTQKEEQAFLNRCRELRKARSCQKEGLSYPQRGPAHPEGTAASSCF